MNQNLESIFRLVLHHNDGLIAAVRTIMNWCVYVYTIMFCGWLVIPDLIRHCEYTLSVNAVQCVWFTYQSPVVSRSSSGGGDT